MADEKNKLPEKSALDQWLNRTKKAPKPTGIEKLPADKDAILSHGQERLWLLDQLYPNQALYNYAHHYCIRGAVQVDLLIQAFQLVAQKHEVLRSNYKDFGKGCNQFVSQNEIPVEKFDLSSFSDEEQKAKIKDNSELFLQQSFNLSKDPLARLFLFDLGSNKFELFFVLHHIAGDAWSLGIINEELSNNYKALIEDQNPEPKELKIQYKDFSYWQRNQQIKPKDLSYWKDKLAGALPSLNFPISNKQTNAFKGKSYHKALSPKLSKELKSFAQEKGITSYVLLLTAYKILLHKYCQQNDIIVATPYSNRDTKELEQLVGFFNETVILRTELADNPSFVEMLHRVKQNSLEAMTHKNVPFDILVNELKIERRAGENPLFQTMFLYNTPPIKLNLGKEVSVVEEMLDLGVSKFDLTLFVNEKQDHLELLFEHNIGFDDQTIESMAIQFEELLINILRTPEEKISNLNLLSENEIIRITKEWNNNQISLPEVESIQELIFKEEYKDQIAVIFGNQTLTYQELDNWSSQIALKLQQKSISENEFIGLYTHRSIEMIVGMMGILKAGGAYLPLDPDYPQERIEFMLSDTNSKIVLSQAGIIDQLDSSSNDLIIIEKDQFDDTTTSLGKPDLLDKYAYVIYTSGSTGRPKGVPITHQNLIHSTYSRFSFYEDQVSSFLLLSSFSFDSSVVGIFWTLCSGGKLVLPPKRIEQDIDLLSTTIQQNKVSHSLMLPSLYQAILSFVTAENLNSLRVIMVAGESCSLSLKHKHFSTLPTVRLYNEYGPTEASVWCIAHEIKMSDNDHNIPIGKAIPNASSYILDSNKQAVPIGVNGELYIGGLGITKGYLNKPDLSAEKIFPNHFEPEKGRIYKTGDLARYRQDGSIEFLGRVDSQIKIRGFRVELEEINSIILQHEKISEAIVKVNGDAESKKIVAYVQSDDKAIESSLLSFLKKRLPEYMIPSSTLVLESFPKLPNGKINMAALPEIKVVSHKLEEYTPAANKTQECLQAIWKEVLGLDQIGIRDNFFDIGGDSIRSIQIIAKAKQMNLQISPTHIFEYQTIGDLADKVQLIENKDDYELEKFPMELPLSYQQQAFLLHSLQSEKDQGILQLEFQFSGTIDFTVFQEAWKKTLEVHPIMRTSFHWEDQAEAYQRIHEYANLNWIHFDLSDKTLEEKANEIDSFKRADLKNGIDLNSASSSRMAFIKLTESSYNLCWTCHHILVDGWSAALILQDALSIYNSLITNESVHIKAVPSYKKYFNWKALQKEEDAKKFWTGILQDIKPNLFSSFEPNSEEGKYEDLTFYLNTDQTNQLQSLVKSKRLTINSIMQGLWMISLASYFEKNDISIGLTVSGRSSDFSGIDRISGLFMNVLPTRKQIKPEQTIDSYLQELQKLQNAMKLFEHFDANKIQQWTKSAENEFFDSLFVFGNFMKDNLKIGDLIIEGFQGGFSSTYPLTIRVNPANKFEINFRFNSQLIAPKSIHWLSESYQTIIRFFISNSGSSLLIKDVIQENSPINDLQKIQPSNSNRERTNDYIGSQNSVQLKLSEIWESILGTNLIGINDNYFELGGTSLSAIQLFSEIESHFGKKLSPTALIANPSIAKLAELISEKESTENWSSIVSMKTSGDKAPLFCIHSGGAHILFYQGLAKHISANRPVYAIQPSGIDGTETHHQSISEMASHYINEMKKVQATGPYHLVGTCFGNAVGLEMMHQLKAKNEEIAVFYVIDSAPAYLIPPSPKGEKKPVSRMLNMVKDGNWNGIIKKIRNRYIRLNKQNKAHQRTDQEIELDEIIDSLNEIYVKYTWKPIDANVVLVRSSEFQKRKDKLFHLKRWEHLTNNKLVIHVVDGHHLTLFNEPEVKGLAQFLGDNLAEIN